MIGCIAKMFARQTRLGFFAPLVAALALAVGSILAAPEGTKELVPKSIVGMTMRYSDLHGNYTVIFKNDANYSFTTTREGQKPETRQGKYKWRATGGKSAVLELEDDTYTLTFHSPGQATGQLTDDVRTYKFTFSK